MDTKHTPNSDVHESKFAFPALVGPDDQVALATNIRRQAIDDMLSLHNRTLESLDDRRRKALIAALTKLPTEAYWWIDRRNDARHCISLEYQLVGWTWASEAFRAEILAHLEVDAVESHAARVMLDKHRRMERARLAGRSFTEQCDFEILTGNPGVIL